MSNAPNGNGNGRDPRRIEGLLASLPLFREVARAHIATIASHSRLQYLRRGAAFFKRGERMPGVIALGYGKLKLSLRSAAGDEKVVRFLGANETFGESAALLCRASPVDAVALEDSMVTVIPAAPLLRLVELDPRFAANVVRELGERFLGLLAELDESLHSTSLERLARYLTSLAADSGAAEGAIARLPVSKGVLAARFGITKETLSRLLRQLSARGLIRVSGREIFVLDLKGLAGIAG